MRNRTIVISVLSILILGFLYFERAILTPFILAAIFAYVLNPVINTLSEKSKVGRNFFIVALYVLFFALLAWGGTYLGKQIFVEAQTLNSETSVVLSNVEEQIASLPEWVQGPARDVVLSLHEAFTIEPGGILPIFSGALSRVFAFITFLFASFYFLKDGRGFIESIILFFPRTHKIEVEILLRKINAVLANYLRGQLLIVLIMSIFGIVLFTTLGVQFSFLLGIGIGLAEVVPMIGPIIAGTTAGLVATFDGVSKFDIPALYDGLLAVSSYIILNQLENYFIVPQVMGRATNLHPLIIFFAVLAGGHLFGILGFILALPTAAILRILFEYVLDKLASS